MDKPGNTIVVERSSAVWRYHLRNGAFVQFSAADASRRRRSFDESFNYNNIHVDRSRPLDAEEAGHNEPILPYLRNYSSQSLLRRRLHSDEHAKAFLRRRVHLLETGR